MAFIFPYIGNNDPNWLIFFIGVETHQPVYIYTYTYTLDNGVIDTIWGAYRDDV